VVLDAQDLSADDPRGDVLKSLLGQRAEKHLRDASTRFLPEVKKPMDDAIPSPPLCIVNVFV